MSYKRYTSRCSGPPPVFFLSLQRISGHCNGTSFHLPALGQLYTCRATVPDLQLHLNTIGAMILTVKLADPGCLQKLRWSKQPQDSWPSSNRQPVLGQKHRYSSEQQLNVMRQLKEDKLKQQPLNQANGGLSESIFKSQDLGVMDHRL